MGRSPWVLKSTVILGLCLTALAVVRPVQAQLYERAQRALDYWPDPLARSPRLLGMGRLRLADDLHNRITLWDFAGNPTGIASAESVSTFEYRPTFRSSSTLKDVTSGTSQHERQELAASQSRHNIETWHRAPGTTAYGLIGEIATLKVDRPYGESVERRGSFVVPGIGGAVNGRVPWIKSDRFDYALRLAYRREFLDDAYYEYFSLPQGQYLGKKTAIVPPPDLFTPNDLQTKELSAGVAFSMRVMMGLQAAIGYDRANVKLRSVLEGLRSTSSVEQDRPYHIGQASLIGRFGPHFEIGADGRAWTMKTEEFFVWTVSAGPTFAPLSGDGKRLDRDERGTTLRTRARWVGEAFDVGAGFNTGYRRAIETPWFPQGAGTPAGFNDFLDQVGYRVGADTLLLPERVTFSQVEERSIDGLVGATWRLPERRGTIGAEYERGRIKNDQAGIPEGARAELWEVRVGGEFPCGDAFLARGGWSYGIRDQDERTTANEYRSTYATVGIGYRPPAGKWSADLGFANEWVHADFADPTQSRGSNRRTAIQLRWAF